jgi:hypothetical protein
MRAGPGDGTIIRKSLQHLISLDISIMKDNAVHPKFIEAGDICIARSFSRILASSSFTKNLEQQNTSP